MQAHFLGKVVGDTIGGIGVAVVGTAFALKTTEIIIGGAVVGIAAYGVTQAVQDW